MNWKELIGIERDVRLNVIADDADIISEFRNSLGFIEIRDGAAAFEVICICSNDEVKRVIFPSSLEKAPEKIRSIAGYCYAKKTKALRADIYTTDGKIEVVVIVRDSLFKG